MNTIQFGSIRNAEIYRPDASGRNRKLRPNQNTVNQINAMIQDTLIHESQHTVKPGHDADSIFKLLEQNDPDFRAHPIAELLVADKQIRLYTGLDAIIPSAIRLLSEYLAERNIDPASFLQEASNLRILQSGKAEPAKLYLSSHKNDPTVMNIVV